MALEITQCPNCNAPLSFPEGSLVVASSFCGSGCEKKGEEKTNGTETSSVFIGEFMCPFKVTKDECEKEVFKWLSDDDETPDDIIESTVLKSFKGYFVPVYVFIGRFRGNWSASSGYDREEHYLDTNSNGLVSKTRTITDWKPISGQVDDEFYAIIYGGKRSEKIDLSIIESAEKYTSFAAAEPVSKTGPYHFVDIESDYHRLWSDRGDQEVDRFAEMFISNQIPGDKKKNLSFSISSGINQVFVSYLPFWVLECRYNEKDFDLFVNAQSLEIYGISPKRPKEARANKHKKSSSVLGLGCLTPLAGC